MALTAGQLATYVQASDADTEFVDSCLNEATTLVGRHVSKALRTVPEDIQDRATLEVGADLYYRRRTRNGVANFDDTEGMPLRISRDPMAAAYPLLAPYAGGGIA